MTDHKGVVEKATTKETFNFTEAVLDRDYPEFDVPVYLNEKNVQKLLTAAKTRDELEKRIASTVTPTVKQAEKLEALQKAYDKLADDLKTDRYIVKVRGISPEESIQIEEKTYETFPRDFEDNISQITGQNVKSEIPSEERDELFVQLLRQAHLVSVTSPTGAVDDE